MIRTYLAACCAAFYDLHVETAYRKRWSSLVNGALLDAAQASGFDVFITADQNLQYQQNLTGRSIALIILDTNRWPIIRSRVEMIRAAIDDAGSGSFRRLGLFRVKG